MTFAPLLGPLSRFTHVHSPESNGMAEVFVNTFKQDHVRVHARPDTATILAQFPAWFEDYSERHPHKGGGEITRRIHPFVSNRMAPGLAGAAPPTVWLRRSGSPSETSFTSTTSLTPRLSE